MKLFQLILEKARHFWYLIVLSNILMLLLGHEVMEGTFNQSLFIKYLASGLSGLLAAGDVLLLICLIRKFISQISFFKNKHLMTTLSISVGAFYNTGYVIFALVSAYFLKSTWYLVFAFYHLTFAIAKHYLGHHLRSDKTEHGNWNTYRWVGIFILFAAFIFHIMVIYVSHHDDQIYARSPFLLYIIALATFINIITAILSLIQNRKFHSLQLKASKNISFSSSLFSIFFLQVMMVREFGTADSPQKIAFMNITLGSVVFGILVILGTYMFIKARKEKELYKIKGE